LVEVPDTLSIRARELDVPLIWKKVVQSHEIPEENTFELDAIGAAIGLTAIMQDAVRIGQMVYRRLRDVVSDLWQ
jgi:hypothetical protein